MKAYTKGQDIQAKPKSYDVDVCGNILPDPIVTTNPRLLLVFRGGSLPGTGFKAKYEFVTGQFEIS